MENVISKFKNQNKSTPDGHIGPFFITLPTIASCQGSLINLVHFSGKGSEAFYYSLSACLVVKQKNFVTISTHDDVPKFTHKYSLVRLY